MAAQPFNFYEGSLATTAFIVPSTKNQHLSLFASSHATLSESQQLSSTSISLDHNEYDSDFEEQELSPPPKRAHTPQLELPKAEPHNKKHLHTFQGKIHPLILGENEHCQIDPHVGNRYPVLMKQESKQSFVKKHNSSSTKSKPPPKKRVTESASKRSLKQALPPLLPHQRKMESILHDIHHPQQSPKRAASIMIRPDVDQVSKLAAVIDELKLKLRERDEEIKTLKIVNRRQDIAIHRTDKNQQDLPKLLQHQSEELRALKHTHSTCALRISNAEKSSQEYIEETIQLREKLAKMNLIVKNRFGEEGATKVQLEVEKIKKELEEKDETIGVTFGFVYNDIKKIGKLQELNKKIKYLENANNMAVREVRLKNSKLTRELEESKANNKQLSEKLEEKARQIAAMSIYSMLHNNTPNPHAPDMSDNDTKSNSKRHVTQTTIRNPAPPNKAHINPQQSVHKPTLAKPHTSSKPNNDSTIRSWNLSQTPLPSSEELMRGAASQKAFPANQISPTLISKRLALLEQSEETPVAIVARRYLLMQLAALEKLKKSPELNVEMPKPPRATQKPYIHGTNGKEEKEEGGEDELAFFDNERDSVLSNH
ncbi:UNVERIFIED_CONTAM: hypothetical protein HDU68_000849 [Siphonaria sp. JEL0065]|nr:hypothetical protein HDU68_000849 [Siphonaria sp. JEL0065]